MQTKRPVTFADRAPAQAWDDLSVGRKRAWGLRWILLVLAMLMMIAGMVCVVLSFFQGRGWALIGFVLFATGALLAFTEQRLVVFLLNLETDW